MRVVIADDHPLFRAGLMSLLRARGGIEVVGEASNGAEAVRLARGLKPDLVLMDLTMPGTGGLDATRRIKEENPDVKVVILTVSETEGDLFAAIQSGAHGYVIKSTGTQEFFELLDALEEGHVTLSGGLAMKIVRHLAEEHRNPPHATTPRESDVLRCVADGLTNREVAAQLGISETTVKFHMTNILNKLHLNNRAQVVAYAHRRGLAEPQV